MWPNLVVNKFLKKNLASNSFVADLPSTPADSTIFTNEEHPNSHQNTLKMFVGSWNVGGVAPPDCLNDIEDWLNRHKEPADIYVFGFQEVVPLSAGNVLGSSGHTTKISRRWNKIIRAALNNNSPPEDSNALGNKKPMDYFQCIVSKRMVGVFISIWVRSDLSHVITHTSVSCVGCGVMGCLGNKGSVSVRFMMGETSLCFVCSHLASGGRQDDRQQRNNDAAEILLRTNFPAAGSHRASSKLPRKILDHDRVIWLGDLNYRIHLPDTVTRSLVQKQQWDILLQNDQLKAELMDGRAFQGWTEGVITFAPTYKYIPNSDQYHGCSQGAETRKKRTPAWCDRIIWSGEEGLKQIHYKRGESRLSDHRPVKAMFVVEIERR